MELLRERILKDGQIYPGNILKVDNFLNHQIDPELILAIGREFEKIFNNLNINKILTVESSGIAPAFAAAIELKIPLVIAKKSHAKNIANDLYTAQVYSYTRGADYILTVAKEFIIPGDKILIIDDFLAMGSALEGLIKVCSDGNAEVAGAGIVIEKGFQGGGDKLRELGYNIKSLAIIEKMQDNKIILK